MGVAIGEYPRDVNLERIAVDAGIRCAQPEHQITALLTEREVSQERAHGIRDNPRRPVLVGVVGGAPDTKGERVRLPQPLRQS